MAIRFALRCLGRIFDAEAARRMAMIHPSREKWMGRKSVAINATAKTVPENPALARLEVNLNS
jgi:hypothetical protein